MYALDNDTGYRISKGENVKINLDELTSINSNKYSDDIICTNCGNSYDVSFNYCPFCGKEKEKR